jgi:hypothetical protein
MKARWVFAAVGLSLAGLAAPASAQYYGGRGYDERDDRYERRGYERRGYDDEYDRPRRRGSSYAFDEGEYLRCNADVRRALRNGQITSAADHWRVFGQREGRRLTC